MYLIRYLIPINKLIYKGVIIADIEHLHTPKVVFCITSLMVLIAWPMYLLAISSVNRETYIVSLATVAIQTMRGDHD